MRPTTRRRRQKKTNKKRRFRCRKRSVGEKFAMQRTKGPQTTQYRFEIKLCKNIRFAGWKPGGRKQLSRRAHETCEKKFSVCHCYDELFAFSVCVIFAHQSGMAAEEVELGVEFCGYFQLILRISSITITPHCQLRRRRTNLREKFKSPCIVFKVLWLCFFFSLFLSPKLLKI